MKRQVLIAIAGLLAATPAAAQPCNRDDPLPYAKDYTKDFEAASAVFVARVTSVEETTAAMPGAAQPQEAVRARFRLIERFKGIPPPDGTILTPIWREHNCGSFIIAGSYFVFFLHDGTNVTLRGDGSFLIYHLEGSDEPGVLQKLRRLKK